MSCPECKQQILFNDVKPRNCPHCDTKICIPKAYFRPAATDWFRYICKFRLLLGLRAVITAPSIFRKQTWDLPDFSGSSDARSTFCSGANGA
jgi:hypothetical protein